MKDSEGFLEDPERKRPPKIMRQYGVTVRFDWPTLQEIDQIALFEREDRAPLLRRIIIDKVKVYERNPQFKRFLKKLEEQKEQEQRKKNT